jgi:hypothetical protein
VTERPTTNGLSSAGTLEVLVGGGPGEPEKLILIDRPRADGQVHVRQWTSANWGAPPISAEYSASGLLRELERAVRQGRGLNRELTVVRRWLQGDEPPAR